MNITRAQAEADLLAVETELVGLIPADVVVERFERVDPATSGSIFACSAPDTFTVPGTAGVRVAVGTNLEALLEAIEQAWAGRAEWISSWADSQSSVGRRLELERADGLRFTITADDRDGIIEISSFSACFAA